MNGKWKMSLQGGLATWWKSLYGTPADLCGRIKPTQSEAALLLGELPFMHGRKAIKSNYSGCSYTRRMKIISCRVTVKLSIF
jgi:hypothetical protein